jgi:glycosyltransferase involved in cell wall biosynthesis
VVVTAPFDAHQERLFLAPFLDRLAARGLLSWRSTAYDASTIASSDLLILVRPRFPQVPGLLAAAAARSLPTLVLVDDNWIAAGREYPRFAELFTPGKPAFETFLSAVRAADATLTFNSVLAEDLHGEARRVVELAPSIDLELFPTPPARRDEGILIGYAGSPRWEDSGFAALRTFLDRHGEARLLLMVHEVPEPLRGIDPARLDLVPWTSDYGAYARALVAAAPDVMVAPLDATRFTSSKVPFKWLDATAAGAVTVCSRVPPYTGFVHDGETGLLVENEHDAWLAALERVAADVELRLRLVTTALDEVRRRFTTAQVLPSFTRALASVLPRNLASGLVRSAADQTA